MSAANASSSEEGGGGGDDDDDDDEGLHAESLEGDSLVSVATDLDFPLGGVNFERGNPLGEDAGPLDGIDEEVMLATFSPQPSLGDSVVHESSLFETDAIGLPDVFQLDSLAGVGGEDPESASFLDDVSDEKEKTAGTYSGESSPAIFKPNSPSSPEKETPPWNEDDQDRKMPAKDTGTGEQKNVHESHISDSPHAVSGPSISQVLAAQLQLQLLHSRGTQLAPILPRPSAAAPSTSIYELPRRGKGTGAKRGEYGLLRESFTSTLPIPREEEGQPPTWSQTFSVKRTGTRLQPFTEKEIPISLNPDPLTHATPRPKSPQEETAPFQEYELSLATEQHPSDPGEEAPCRVEDSSSTSSTRKGTKKPRRKS